MSASTPSDSAYHIVLSKIREGSNNSQIAAKLGQAFSMPGNRVDDAMQRIPVVLFESLDRSQADGMKDTLRDLAQLGIDFKITRKIDGIASAAWPLGGERATVDAVPAEGEDSEPTADRPLTIGSVNFASPSGLEKFRIDFKIYLIEGALGSGDRAALTVDTVPLGAAPAAVPSAPPAPPVAASSPRPPSSTAGRPVSTPATRPVSTPATRPVSEAVKPLPSETVQAATARPSTAEAAKPAVAAKTPAPPPAPKPPSKPAVSRYEDEDVEELEELEELDDLDDSEPPPDSEGELDEIGDDVEELSTQDELPGEDDEELEELRDLDEGDDESTSDELLPLAGDEDDEPEGKSKAYADDRTSAPSDSANADVDDDIEELEDIEDLDDVDSEAPSGVTDSAATDEDVEDLDDLEELEDVEELEDEPESDDAGGDDEELEDLEELEDIEESEDEPESDDAGGDDEELEDLEELEDIEESEDEPESDDAADDEELEDLDDIEELEDEPESDVANDDDDLEELEEPEAEEGEEDDDLAPIGEDDMDDERTIIDDGGGRDDDFEVEGDLEDIDEIDDDAPRGKSAKPSARPGFGKKAPEPPKKPAPSAKGGGTDKKGKAVDVKPDSVEGISVVEEELKPWSGRARDYTHAPRKGGDASKGGKPGTSKVEAKGSGKDAGKAAAGSSKGGKPSKGGEGSGDYSLFLSKIKNKDKKHEAAAIIAEVTGCSQSAAVEMCDRMIISVIKGSTKEYADEVLAKFTAIGVAGRVTAKK